MDTLLLPKFAAVQKITIAIDGYSSCGKSTLARALSQKLGYEYIDTGAMYRAVTWYALEKDIMTADYAINKKTLFKVLPKLEISFRMNPATHHSDVYLNSQNIEREIRTMRVSNAVSKISAIREVRAAMVGLQRKMGKRKGVVLDGRDIGTQVFPKAELKLFMTADPEVRARRRMDEFSSKGQYFSLEEIEQSLKQRDHEDMTRKESPLVQAEDAVVLDNSDLNKEEQLEFVLKLISDLQLIRNSDEAQLKKHS
jgi:CMP/dCMP kinase